MFSPSRRTLLAGSAAILSTTAAAQGEPEPVRIARALYAPYIADQLGKGALDLIKPHAAPELRRLILREEACSKKNGICNIDVDVLTDSQDPQVRSIQTTVRDARGDAMTVRVSFRHTGARTETVIDIPVVRSGGRWLITDVRRVGGSGLVAMLKPPAP